MLIIEEKRQSSSLAEVRQLIESRGERVCVAFETERTIYASSVRSCGPATFGHPAVEAMFSKDTGYLTLRA